MRSKFPFLVFLAMFLFATATMAAPPLLSVDSVATWAYFNNDSKAVLAADVQFDVLGAENFALRTMSVAGDEPLLILSKRVAYIGLPGGGIGLSPAIGVDTAWGEWSAGLRVDYAQTLGRIETGITAIGMLGLGNEPNYLLIDPASIRYRISDQWAAGLQCYAMAIEGDKLRAQFGPGVQWQATKNLAITAAYMPWGDAPKDIWTLGAKWTF